MKAKLLHSKQLSFAYHSLQSFQLGKRLSFVFICGAEEYSGLNLRVSFLEIYFPISYLNLQYFSIQNLA